MYEKIRTQLKRLKTIRPDEDFVHMTKARVLSGEGPHVVSPFVAIGGAAAVATFAVLLIVLFFNPAPPTVSALDTNSITRELGGLKLDLQLQRLDYNQEVHNTITTALTEIGGKTNHLNEQLIKSEDNLVGTLNTSSSEQINSLLNKVLN